MEHILPENELRECSYQTQRKKGTKNARIKLQANVEIEAKQEIRKLHEKIRR